MSWSRWKQKKEKEEWKKKNKIWLECANRKKKQITKEKKKEIEKKERSKIQSDRILSWRPQQQTTLPFSLYFLSLKKDLNRTGPRRRSRRRNPRKEKQLNSAQFSSTQQLFIFFHTIQILFPFFLSLSTVFLFGFNSVGLAESNSLSFFRVMDRWFAPPRARSTLFISLQFSLSFVCFILFFFYFFLIFFWTRPRILVWLNSISFISCLCFTFFNWT